MANVFQDMAYALQYEQFAAETGTYKLFAGSSVDLASKHRKPEEINAILELGSGTGIGTIALGNQFKGAKIDCIDASEDFIKITMLKFGILDGGSKDEIVSRVRISHFYPGYKEGKLIDKGKDLESRLEAEASSNANLNNRVRLYCGDAKDLATFQPLQGKTYDMIFGTQFFHWLWLNESTDPQLVFNAMYTKLNPGGIVAGNTTAVDYRFSDSRKNDAHLSNHPFLQAFSSAFDEQLRKRGYNPEPRPKDKQYKLSKAVLEKTLKQAGFKQTGYETIYFTLDPELVIPTCFVGGQMHLIQKYGMTIPPKQRQEILYAALVDTLSKNPLPTARLDFYGKQFIGIK